MEAIMTADGKYSYDMLINGISLHDWVTEVNKYNSIKNGWKIFPLKKGAFGYDNLAMCIGYIHSKIDSDTTLEEMADMVHEGWILNYVYWRDNQPWNRADYIYHKPTNKLGDDRRNKCAETSHRMLPKDERDKDIIIAEFLKHQLIN